MRYRLDRFQVLDMMKRYQVRALESEAIEN
jgi:hypothetical protein